MKKLLSAATANAFSGFLVILPLAILLIAGLEVYDLLEETAAFAELQLPCPGFINALIYIGLVLAAIFAICLLVGLLLKTGPGSRFAKFVESSIAEKIPLLSLVRNLTINIAGRGQQQLSPVEVDLQGNGSSVLALLMETLEDGRVVIFIPGAPAVTLGTIHLVPRERVKNLNASTAALAGVVSQWGAGATDLFKNRG